MEEVSSGFGVAFPGKYESGDFEEDYELLDKDTELSNENNIQGN